jgi:hypothetical protein
MMKTLKRRWLFIFSGASMLLVTLLWVLYLGNTLTGVAALGQKKEGGESGFFATMTRGTAIVGSETARFLNERVFKATNNIDIKKNSDFQLDGLPKMEPREIK